MGKNILRSHLLDFVGEVLYDDLAISRPTVQNLVCLLQLPSLVGDSQPPGRQVVVNEELGVAMTTVVLFQLSTLSRTLPRDVVP